MLSGNSVFDFEPVSVGVMGEQYGRYAGQCTADDAFAEKSLFVYFAFAIVYQIISL